MRSRQISLGALPLAALVGIACNLSQAVPPTPTLEDRVATAVVQTVVALASPTPVASPTLPPQPTASETPTPSATLPPTAIPTATPTSIPCNWAAFVKDISVPDGSEYRPGDDFTKTWRLRNIGGCAWDKGTSLVFSHGDRLGGPADVRLDRSVASGSTVDISVRFEAPGKQGSHRGYWQLRSNSGVLFGIGPSADKPIWVDIRVAAPRKTVYRFADDPCIAKWATHERRPDLSGHGGRCAGLRHPAGHAESRGRTDGKRASTVGPAAGQR